MKVKKINAPHPVEFHSIKQLINRFNVNRNTEKDSLISTEDTDVPRWQRQIVWDSEDMGLLAYSIVRNYPIGMMVIWKRKDGIRVPIDGRQRLRAIKEFAEGRVAIPNIKGISDELKNAKYKMLEGDKENGYKQLNLVCREAFDDYELSIVQYDEIDEPVAMDIFVKLQGGKSLTKTEVRAALGGKLCDFVTELTGETKFDVDESDEEEQPSRHPFFKNVNIRNVRKAHRNLCDVLLHEYLYSGQDKHWSSLETMYFDKFKELDEKDKAEFRAILKKFQHAVEFEESKQRNMLPQLKSTFLILSFFKAWREITKEYALPKNFSFVEIVGEFEKQRLEKATEIPWVNFSAALSNAGYAQNRINIRHDILMSFIIRKYPGIIPKDKTRNFTESQKIAIWDRANKQCEWISKNNKQRCRERFINFREADADHIVKWIDGGPTSLENGRLLCKQHNRAPREQGI